MSKLSLKTSSPSVERLKAEAQRLFANHGIDGVTARDIAKAAGPTSISQIVDALIYPSVNLAAIGEADTYNRFLRILTMSQSALFYDALGGRWNSGYQRCLKHLWALIPAKSRTHPAWNDKSRLAHFAATVTCMLESYVTKKRNKDNRAENSHLPFRCRERAMLKFRRMRSLQNSVTTHSSVYNHFNRQRNIESRTRLNTPRDATLLEWRKLPAA